MLEGSLVAIATPMQPGGELDLSGLRKLIDFHIANGTAGIVIVGTTGESPTVDFEEHCLLIKTAVESAKGRIPVIAGTGSNSTAEAIEQTEYAKKVGASYGLSVVPYYNKPSQEGLYLHFKTIAERVELPLLVYNVPGRTMADLATDTVLRLAELPGIVGIKDATSDLVRHVDLLRRVSRAAMPAVIAATILAGCESMSTLSLGKKIDYKSAGTVSALEVPPDLTTPTYDDRYQVSTASGVAAARAAGRSTELLPVSPDARVARSGSERWLVVKATQEAA